MSISRTVSLSRCVAIVAVLSLASAASAQFEFLAPNAKATWKASKKFDDTKTTQSRRQKAQPTIATRNSNTSNNARKSPSFTFDPSIFMQRPLANTDRNQRNTKPAIDVVGRQQGTTINPGSRISRPALTPNRGVTLNPNLTSPRPNPSPGLSIRPGAIRLPGNVTLNPRPNNNQRPGIQRLPENVVRPGVNVVPNRAVKPEIVDLRPNLVPQRDPDLRPIPERAPGTLLDIDDLVGNVAPVLPDGVLPLDPDVLDDLGLGDDLPGDDLPGDDLPGADLPGDDLPGDDLPGDDLPGDDLPGDDHPEDHPGHIVDHCIDIIIGLGRPGCHTCNPCVPVCVTGNCGHIAVPANVIPAGVVVILNPLETGAPVNFLIDGRPFSLEAGQTGEFEIGDRAIIEFDRGGHFGLAQYTLKNKVYAFKVTDQGWDLIRKVFKATIDNSLNPHDFHYLIGNEPMVVAAGESLEHVSDFPMVATFDGGDGQVFQKALGTDIYAVSVNPETQLWDLIPASAASAEPGIE